MASNPPARCCTLGSLHEGDPKGKIIKIDNTIEAYVATPVDKTARADVGILYLPDVIGIWQNSKLMADAFAERGYLTVVVDLFNGDPVLLNRPEGFELAKWLAHGSTGDNPHTKEAVDPIVVKAIEAMRGMGVKHIGAVGYCFGAKYVVRHYKDGIEVGYAAHPSFVDEDELAAITGPFAISAAETDSIFPAEKRHKSEEILAKTKQPYQINLFSNTVHGFAVRGDVGDKQQNPRLSSPHLSPSPDGTPTTLVLPDPATRTGEPPQLIAPTPSLDGRSRTASSPVRTWTEQQKQQQLLLGGGSLKNGAVPDRGRSDTPRPATEYAFPQQQPTPPPYDDDEPPPLPPPAQTKSRRGSSNAKTGSADNVPRLPAAEMQELMASPLSLPIGPAPPGPMRLSFDHGKFSQQKEEIRQSLLAQPELRTSLRDGATGGHHHHDHHNHYHLANGLGIYEGRGAEARNARTEAPRPACPRTVSTPPTGRGKLFELPPYSTVMPRSAVPPPSQRLPPLSLHVDDAGSEKRVHSMLPSPAIPAGSTPVTTETKASGGSRAPSPMPPLIPLPPMSLPTHLQLELAGQRPSPLYIHHSHTSDIPYESSAVKFERLLNVILLPAYLERTLYFGALACLDAWLHTFTILPIRFFMAIGVLVRWWLYVVGKETRFLLGFVWDGIGRLWRRGRTTRGRTVSGSTAGDRSRSISRASEPASAMGVDGLADTLGTATQRRTSAQHREKGPGPKSGSFRHRRTKSMPSNLSTYHKADLLQGAVILCSSFALMRLDASRMYHFIRAQSAIKLYVIFNILEVGDRLLSAIGQDILECLFSAETLSRNASGRSKILLPLGMFLLALAYNCLHSIALYYQVITLNVAVNSYSNALLTLLLSNQFVEIKSTVFKRFEKDNLFQLTCADVVERFQLWIMLLIIAMRNIVEVGGFSVPGAGVGEMDIDGNGSGVPLHHPSSLPHSFTALPSWLWSGEVLSPFLIVVGSEMLVDTIKHAYVTKFNNIKPHFYSRTLDILCKDYYTHAFASPSLTRRLGLAVIPLSCLFIRASVQTYHMFLASYLPMPLPQSTQTSLAEESARPSSPAMMAALNRFDALIRDSLGRATYGPPTGSAFHHTVRPWYAWTSDDLIAALTMVVVFFIAFLVLLILKLLLGMALLKYARGRYAAMKRKEQLVARGVIERESYDAKGRRAGGHGDIELSDDRQRWIHADKTEGLKGGKGPSGRRPGEDKKAPELDYNGVFRYDMVNKRIW
ncbi:Membrane, Tapt1 CMV receptor [Cordyceps militaris]|uniref:Membrane, Tapt1 CMV receptor n=1 Tax=Cordyceps militaris TaxID=73501 RepID=A0A2H4SB05_CORMI|nr:Membrane, Tapt1 CMV receptor [Cordyceps militaris]